MTRTTAITLPVFLLALAAGCSAPLNGDVHSSYGLGPTFVLPVSDSAEVLPTIPITIGDDRPDWERTYYPGSNLPHRHEYAVTFLPLENFEPSFRDRLRAEVRQELRRLESPPDAVEICIQSFQFVYDERFAQKAKFELLQRQKRKREEDRERRDAVDKRRQAERDRMFGALPNDNMKDNSETSFASEIIGGILGFFLQQSFNAVAQETKLTAKEIQNGEYQLGKPPKELADVIRDGISCRLQGTVVLRWNDGRKEKTELKAESTLVPGLAGLSADDIPVAVTHCMSRFSSQVAKAAATRSR